MKLNFGDKVRDKVTGFTGIVVARSEWMNGCVRIGIQSQKLKDGKPMDVEHFDEQQVELVQAAKLSKAEPSGGPQQDAKRQQDPRQ